ncbi:hypothetical protein [Streptomyces nigrescens]|uniref:hypothetical protein n=1 Tax=Streptomyces nigrescens TaxID=1920 RepID=UPI0037016298
MAEPTEFAVIVSRTDGGSTRIGPIPFKHVAEDMTRSFSSFSTRPERDGVTSEVVVYDPGVRHLPLVPAEADRILAVIEDPDQGFEAPFPNLWDRLVAQHGLQATDRAWREAVSSDHAEVKNPLCTAQAEADVRFDLELRQLVSALIGSGNTDDAAVEEAVADIRRTAEVWAQKSSSAAPGRARHRPGPSPLSRSGR